MTVFLTTHYMEESADADYVVVLDGGRIAAEGTPLKLKNAYTGDFITLYGATGEQMERLNTPYEKIRDAYRVAVPDTAAATRPDYGAARTFLRITRSPREKWTMCFWR